MTCIIIEDEIQWRSKLQLLLDDLGVSILGIATTVAEAIALFKKNEPQFIIADILLGNELVFDVYTKNVKYCQIPTIFLTSSDKEIHYKQAKFIKNYMYIIKPIHKLTLRSSIEKILNVSFSKEIKKIDYLIIKGKYNEDISVPYDKIIYLSQNLKYCTIHTAHKQFTIKKSMQDVELLLDDSFLRVHTSFCVNVQFIKSIGIGLHNIKLTVSDIVVPIGIRYIAGVKKHIADKGISEL